MKTLEILQIEVDNLKKLNNELALKNNELSGEVERLKKQWISVKDENPLFDQLYDVAVYYPSIMGYHVIKSGYVFKQNHPNKRICAANFFQKPKYFDMGVDEEIYCLDERMITHFRPHVPVPKIEV